MSSLCPCPELLVAREVGNDTCTYCTCTDIRFAGPECEILISAKLNRADIVVYAISTTIALILLVLVLVEDYLVVRHLIKTRHDPTHEGRYFPLLGSGSITLSHIAELVYYSMRIYDSYVIDTVIGNTIRFATLSIMGNLLVITTLLIALTWISLISRVSSLSTTTAFDKIRWLLWGLIAIISPISVTLAIAYPAAVSSGDTDAAGLLRTTTSIVTAVLVIIVLLVMSYHTIISMRWFAKIEHRSKRVEMAYFKTKLLVAILVSFALLLLLVVYRFMVISYEMDFPWVRLVGEVGTIIIQNVILIMSYGIVVKHTKPLLRGVGMKIPFILSSSTSERTLDRNNDEVKAPHLTTSTASSMVHSNIQISYLQGTDASSNTAFADDETTIATLSIPMD